MKLLAKICWLIIAVPCVMLVILIELIVIGLIKIKIVVASLVLALLQKKNNAIVRAPIAGALPKKNIMKIKNANPYNILYDKRIDLGRVVNN